MKKKHFRIAVLCIITAFTLLGCSKGKETNNQNGDANNNSTQQGNATGEDNTTGNESNEKDTNAENITQKPQSASKEAQALADKLAPYFEDLDKADSLKKFGYKNPLMTQRLGADPYAIVYEGRVYIYMTGDVVEYDAAGGVMKNSYGRINTLNVISSEDLVNWTDHGAIAAAGPNGAAKWGNNSWAPAVAHKEIDGKTKFFIYFANGGNGIGVLTSDSPTGPFTDPINRALISRSTPNCANVSWLFDPAVLVDDDGKAYLYFGGGIPGQNFAKPGTGRIVQLGDDMISLAGVPVVNDVPYLFEDSGINKIGDTYYYSYCSNWNVDEKDRKTLGFGNAEIIYMTSKSPMGPFTLQGSILKNPGTFFGVTGNNHHCLFEFNDQWYIAYHSQILEKRMGIQGGYRTTHIDTVTVNKDGKIQPITGTEIGVTQLKKIDPYTKTEAETIGIMGGIKTSLYEASAGAELRGTGNLAISDINSGDWVAVYGVDFGTEGAKSITANIKPPKDQSGAIQIRLDNLGGDVIGYLEVGQSETDEYQEITAELLTNVTGEHNLVFMFYGEGYSMDYWQFQK